MRVVRYRVLVSGQVQGVWYRESCRREAESCGVTGWVRNNSDGTVEAVLEGDEPAVARLLAWMREGPPLSIVTDLQLHAETPIGEPRFTVH